MELEFSGVLWFWKGPSPFHFISVPEEESGVLEESAVFVSYGWGMIPVTAQIGETEWTTSLFPKDGRYVLPVKAAIRKAVEIELGDEVEVQLAVDV
jgi:hypothetical protein